MKNSLIIPIYNEDKVIRRTLEEIESFIKKEKDEWEILLVNDGSTDKTLEILKNFKNPKFKIVSYSKNQGKGYAIKKGVEFATGNYICFTDSDLAYSFNNLKKLLSSLEKFDVVIGSRTLFTDNHEKITLTRRIFGRVFSILSNFILNYQVEDTQCGLKAFRGKVAKDLFSKQTIKGFSFDTEILYLVYKKNYTLAKEKAIVSKKHTTKESKVNLLLDPPKMFLDLIKIKLNGLLGKYG